MRVDYLIFISLLINVLFDFPKIFITINSTLFNDSDP